MGIDSILIAQLRNVLEGVFEELPTDLFFEYTTIDALVQYFLEHHAEELENHQFAEEEGQKEAPVTESSATTVQAEANNQIEALEDYLKSLVAAAINVPVEEIDSNISLEDYGIDSILMVQLRQNLEQYFKEIPIELFFEYPDILSLTEYFKTVDANELQFLAAREEVNSNSIPVADTEKTDLSSYLTQLVAATINLPVDRIETDIPLEQYGIDSILVVNIRNQIENDFMELPVDYFFLDQTITELAAYLKILQDQEQDGVSGNAAALD